MTATTIPTAPISDHARLARAYVAAIHREAQRRRIPLDHYAPPVGLCCVPPPAMVST